MCMVKSTQRDSQLIMYRDTPLDLQPAKYYMQIGRIFHIAIYPGILLDLPEPSIEKKNIAIYYILVLEVPFCCFCLPKMGFHPGSRGTLLAIKSGSRWTNSRGLILRCVRSETRSPKFRWPNFISS